MTFFYLAHALLFFVVVYVLGLSVTGPRGRALWVWAVGTMVVSFFVVCMLVLGFSWRTQTVLFWGGFALLLALRMRQAGAKLFVIEVKANAWLALVFILFSLFQFSFLAIPNAEIISRGFHSMRSHGLFSDCYLSHRFAEMIMLRQDPDLISFVGDWQITDRGPLVALLFAGEWAVFGFGPDNYPHFVALVITLNSLMVVAGVSLLRRLGGSPLAAAMLVAMLTLSEWGSMNMWYTWPKCFGTALFMLGIEALVFDRQPARAGVWVALSLLAHGMALFEMPLVLLFFVWSKANRDWRGLAKFTATLVLVQLPWSLYKTFWHPDNGRLMKSHLFSHPAPTTDSLLTVGKQYWDAHTVGELLRIRLENFAYVFDPTFFYRAMVALTKGDVAGALNNGWLFSFRQLFGAFDIFLVGAVLIAIVTWRSRGVLVAPMHAGRLRWLLILALGGALVPIAAFGSSDDAMSNHQWVYTSLLVLQIVGAILLERRWGAAAWWWFVPAAIWELAVLYQHHLVLDLWTTATQSWSLVLNVIALVAVIFVGCVWPSRKLASHQ